MSFSPTYAEKKNGISFKAPPRSASLAGVGGTLVSDWAVAFHKNKRQFAGESVYDEYTLISDIVGAEYNESLFSHLLILQNARSPIPKDFEDWCVVTYQAILGKHRSCASEDKVIDNNKISTVISKFHLSVYPTVSDEKKLEHEYLAIATFCVENLSRKELSLLLCLLEEIKIAGARVQHEDSIYKVYLAMPYSSNAAPSRGNPPAWLSWRIRYAVFGNLQSVCSEAGVHLSIPRKVMFLNFISRF